MVQIAKLSADLTANISNFETNLKRAGSYLGSVKRAWKSDLKDIDNAFGAVGGAIGKAGGVLFGLKSLVASVAGAAGLTLLVKSSVDAASAINDMAERLQVGTGDLQKFQFAAKIVGTSAETLETGITRLNAKIADGSFKYKDATEGLYSIADAVLAAKTTQEKLAIVNDAFTSKLGSKMLPLLANGSKGLKDFGDQAERAGAVLSDKTIKAADAFGDSMDIIGTSLTKSFQQGFLDSFVDKSGELRATFTDPNFTEGIRSVGTEIGNLTALILEAVASIGRFIGEARKVHKFRDEIPMPADLNPPQVPAGQQQSTTKENGFTLIRAPDIAPTVPSGTRITPYTQSGKTNKELASAAEEAQKAINNLLESLQLEDDTLAATTGTWGKSAGAIARATKELEINTALKKKGITLSAAQQAQMNKELDQLETLTNKKIADAKADQDRAQAMQEVGHIFGSAFEDAILSGKKFGDVLNSLLADLAKFALEKQVLIPLENTLFGDGTPSSGGGLLGNVFGSIFGGVFGSHAQGLDYVPRDMMVRVHKGEEIVSRRDVDAGRNSHAGVTVNVIDKNESAISTRGGQNGNGLQLDVMVDRATAKNINRPGSQTTQALSAKQNRTLIRR